MLEWLNRARLANKARDLIPTLGDKALSNEVTSMDRKDLSSVTAAPKKTPFKGMFEKSV